jgi:hypothetical protein
MAGTVFASRWYPSWQFSLKSLLFVTTVVAICAALVYIALPLAVLAIPFVAAALVRTMFVTSRQDAKDTHGPRPTLFATFCFSIFLIVATIMMSLAATALAGIAASLFALAIVRRVLSRVVTLIRPVAVRLWQLMIAVWKSRKELIARLESVAILDSLQLWSVAATLSLVSASRRLFRQCWCPPRAAFDSSNGHATTRTDPL